MKKCLLVVMVLGLLWPRIAVGADEGSAGPTSIPHLINYQARLTTPSGNPVHDGIYEILFGIYNAPTGGTAKWDHTYSVKVTKGLFNVILGESEPLDLPFDEDYWLEIKVGNDQPLLPRTRITSVGYAYRAEVANSALSAGSGGGWVDDGAVVRLSTGSDSVGIGTTSPKSKFQIGNWLTFHDGPYQFMGFNWSWWNGANRRINDGGAARLMFYEDDGTLVFQSKPFGAAGEELSAGATMFIKNWYVGIGTGDPKYRLHVKSGTIGIEVEATPFVFQEIGQTGTGSLWRMPLDGKHLRFDVSHNGADFSSYTTVLDMKPTGRVAVPVLEITGGSDLAEPFPISYSETLQPGSVAIIDEQNPGHLTLSTRPYDQRIAGVVSGAGGINSGLTLSQQGLMEGDQNIALNGRVYALATTSNGSILPGDLLTTSAVAGHAMKATDRELSFGAILGKAMTSLMEGEGLVLVLVNLQ